MTNTFLKYNPPPLKRIQYAENIANGLNTTNNQLNSKFNISKQVSGTYLPDASKYLRYACDIQHGLQNVDNVNLATKFNSINNLSNQRYFKNQYGSCKYIVKKKKTYKYKKKYRSKKYKHKSKKNKRNLKNKTKKH